MKKKKIRASNVARRAGAEARTARNKKLRMTRHAKRYPHTNTMPAAKRRAIGTAWKKERDRRDALAGSSASI